ncbi:hypothetical protein [Lysinibacillus sp. LZ02]|uniref:hypothetical protein n=1 Tax=Lysinibacillus sp. LZ02 TaxID=3420668 RepID=UPI003D36E541
MLKKLLLVAGMLCLAGCAENEAIGVSHANAAEVAQHQESSTLSETQITRQQQLGKVLEQIAQRFGTMPNNATYYNNGFGLVHAGLMDINQDGQNEMYILLKGSPYANAELTHRNQGSYIFEIWAGNEKADEAQLLFHEAINLDSSATSDVSISFIQSTSGETFVKRNHFRTKDGTNYIFSEQESPCL